MAVGARAPERPTKSARTRQRILEAAARVFSERGYTGTRLTDIAAAADMQTGSLYYHFDSKDALVEEVLRAGVRATHDHVRGEVDALGRDANAGERLRTAVAAHAAAVIQVLDYAAANVRILGQVPDEVRRRHRRDQRRYGDFWRGLFDEARQAGEIRADLDLLVVRMLVIGSLNWSVEWPAALRRSPERVAATLNAVLFEGLAPRS